MLQSSRSAQHHGKLFGVITTHNNDGQCLQFFIGANLGQHVPTAELRSMNINNQNIRIKDFAHIQINITIGTLKTSNEAFKKNA